MKAKKYLELFYQFHKDGCPFLCHHFNAEDLPWRSNKQDPLFLLFVPNEKEISDHIKEGFSSNAWGGSRLGDSSFTDLRQNIILLMAAMNDEL
jgi:hypothetical protein